MVQAHPGAPFFEQRKGNMNRRSGVTLVELMVCIVIAIVVSLLILGCIRGCSQISAKSFGGTTTMQLDPGRKLVNVTWKEKQLWLVTAQRPVEEKPQTYTFEERTTLGILQGKVIIEER